MKIIHSFFLYFTSMDYVCLPSLPKKKLNRNEKRTNKREDKEFKELLLMVQHLSGYIFIFKYST